MFGLEALRPTVDRTWNPNIDVISQLVAIYGGCQELDPLFYALVAEFGRAEVINLICVPMRAYLTPVLSCVTERIASQLCLTLFGVTNVVRAVSFPLRS